MLRCECVFTLVLSAVAAAVARGEAPNFTDEVAPLLKAHCVQCHGPAKREAGLNLSLPTTVARGGENGPVIVAGSVDESLLWQRISADEMPPESPLSRDEKEALRHWIEAGAPGLPEQFAPVPDGDEHWAYQPPRLSGLPEVRDGSRVHTPVDRFIQARLERTGLSIGPEADRATLIRRVALDLTGLPPSPEDMEAFERDPGEGAYEAMVDRFLASPHYGARWGKYWLDAAGYADSNGYFSADTDRPLAYRYRDWVIRAVNNDQPFDAFLRDQLAGDELAGYHAGAEVTDEMLERLAATHFLRNSPDGTDSSDGNDDERRADKYAVLEGTLQILGSSLLGLTVQCARCHDHKFEPFAQREYYQLQAVFYPAFNVEQWAYPRDRQLPAVPSTELRAWEAKARRADEQIAAERELFAAWVREHQPRGATIFRDGFDVPEATVFRLWRNTVPGDDAPAGSSAVNVDSATPPGAEIVDGRLHIIESGEAGDRALSTRDTFDWTPNEPGAWIQATFDLVSAGEVAPYVGCFLALRDFNDLRGLAGGNVLIDGSREGKAKLHVDYPGDDVRAAGEIGQSGYQPGRNYGVRVTNRGEGKFEVAQVVDGQLEEGKVALTTEDLPDGGFGFEYCCGRSFVVDNVVIAASDGSPEVLASEAAFASQRAERERRLIEAITGIEKARGDAPGQLAFVTDLAPEPPAVHLLERGSYKAPGDAVQPLGPAMISEADDPADPDAQRLRTGHTTGRRLAFAHWLTKPNSRAAALLARVTVNRWWAHHFGAGIVATPENLGYSGAPPTHPELLDYLAAEFMCNGWSAKAFHRLILCSAVYRQRSIGDANSAERDPEARLLSRFPLHRLDAETIRDAMLAASGDLDPKGGGPFVPTTRGEDGDVVVAADAPGANRRSVFLQQRRTQVLGMLDVFDAPSLVTNCTQRVHTTIPLQSLKLLNSEFVRARAQSLAARTLREEGTEEQARVARAYLLALGRRATDGEAAAASAFLREQRSVYADDSRADELAWTDFCHAILASNAFLYVE